MNATALCEQAINQNHIFKFELDDKQILSTIQSYKQLLVTEMCHIQLIKSDVESKLINIWAKT